MLPSSRRFPAALPGEFGEKLGFCSRDGKTHTILVDLAGNGRIPRHKTDKRSPPALSKAALRWYIPLAAQGLVPRVGLLRKPPDGIDALKR